MSVAQDRQNGMRCTRWIAWDSVCFPVPDDWDLAGHDTHRGVSSLRLEDAGEVRLQLEWAPLTAGGACAAIRRRHDALADRMARLDATVRREPSGASRWATCAYRLADGTGLVTALHLGEDWPVCVLASLHAAGDASYPLESVARRLLEGFRYAVDGPVSWTVFDLDCRVPPCFRLVSSSFLAGRKQLVFEWRLRRLWIWRFSLADRLLANRSAADALAAHLNACRDLPGVRFEVTPDEQVVARRRRAYPLGHAVEIGRWCFRYHCLYRHDDAGNALMAALFHYRRADEREILRGLEWLPYTP